MIMALNGAKNVVATEKSNISSSLEDYLEAIFNLEDGSSTVHSKDIARSLNVSKASVTGACRLLKSKGLANYKPYDCVSLTKEGNKAAIEVVKKHNILKAFFINVLGIHSAQAQKAACKAEHALGPEVINRLLDFIEFATKQQDQGQNLVHKFQKFCRQKPEGKKHE